MKLGIQLEDVESIFTREDILENLDRIPESIAAFYSDIPPETFFAIPSDGGWSAEKNLRHLIKATQPIYLGLMSPKFTLFIFGSSKEKSRTISEIKQAYQAKLNSGSGAGVFTPIGENKKIDSDVQKKLVQDFLKLFAKYKRQIAFWEDGELDTHNMPHPILGNITVREMILFSIYHLFHHTSKVEARLS